MLKIRWLRTERSYRSSHRYGTPQRHPLQKWEIICNTKLLSSIQDPSGLLVSGVYCFDKNDKNIKVTNTKADKNLLTTVITKNKAVQYGLDGIVFDKEDNLYVGNLETAPFTE